MRGLKKKKEQHKKVPMKRTDLFYVIAIIAVVLLSIVYSRLDPVSRLLSKEPSREEVFAEKDEKKEPVFAGEISLSVGDTYILRPEVNAGEQVLSFRSENEESVVVDAGGTITVICEYSTDILVEIAEKGTDGYTATKMLRYHVAVNGYPVIDMEQEIKVRVGEYRPLLELTESEDVLFETEDESIAAISGYELLLGVKKGSTTLTIKYYYFIYDEKGELIQAFYKAERYVVVVS